MNQLWRDTGFKRALAACMLALYLASSLGLIPSPAMIGRLFGRAVSEPFPCQDHGCGCASAHECWTNCCCYTPHQRLTWAIRRGVTPPPSAHYTDEQWIAASNDVTPDSAHCSLCVADIKSDLEQGTGRDASTPECPETEDALAGTCGSGSSGSCCTTAAASCDSSSIPWPSVSALSCKDMMGLLAFALPVAAPLRLLALLDPPPRLPPFDRPENLAHTTRALDVAAPPPRARVVIG